MRALPEQPQELACSAYRRRRAPDFLSHPFFLESWPNGNSHADESRYTFLPPELHAGYASCVSPLFFRPSPLFFTFSGCTSFEISMKNGFLFTWCRLQIEDVSSKFGEKNNDESLSQQLDSSFDF